MTGAVILTLALLLGGGIYTVAKQRGVNKKAMEVMDREGELDREEIDNELDEKRDSNAWDNLTDTIDDLSK